MQDKHQLQKISVYDQEKISAFNHGLDKREKGKSILLILRSSLQHCLHTITKITIIIIAFNCYNVTTL